MLLVQVDPERLASGLAANPLAWGLVLTIGAIVFLFKALIDGKSTAAKELAEAKAQAAKDLADERAKLGAALADAQAKLVEQLRADAKEQKETLSSIVPLAHKLTEALEILERVTAKKE